MNKRIRKHGALKLRYLLLVVAIIACSACAGLNYWRIPFIKDEITEKIYCSPNDTLGRLNENHVLIVTRCKLDFFFDIRGKIAENFNFLDVPLFSYGIFIKEKQEYLYVFTSILAHSEFQFIYRIRLLPDGSAKIINKYRNDFGA